MRKAERELTRAEAEEILERGEYGTLSTVCSDGFPYGVPVSYAYRDGRIYIHHTSDSSLLSSNIGDGAKACFTVVGRTRVLPERFSTEYESAVAFGTVRACPEKTEALMMLARKYSPGFGAEAESYVSRALDDVTVFELEIEHLTGKARRPKPVS